MRIAKIQINFNYPMLLTEMQHPAMFFCHFFNRNGVLGVFL